MRNWKNTTALTSLAFASVLMAAPAAATTSETLSSPGYASGFAGQCEFSIVADVIGNRSDTTNTDYYRVSLTTNSTRNSTLTSSQIFRSGSGSAATFFAGSWSDQTTEIISIPSSAVLPNGISWNIVDTTSPSSQTGRVRAVTAVSLADLNAAGGNCATIAANSGFGNNAPVADAGPDQTLNNFLSGQAQVSLNGTNSMDPDGDPLTYRWRQASGTPITFDNPHLPNASFTFNSNNLQGTQQVVVLELIVNDGTVDSPADTVSVTANFAQTSIGTPNNFSYTDQASVCRIEGDSMIFAASDDTGLGEDFIEGVITDASGNILADQPGAGNIILPGMSTTSRFNVNLTASNVASVSSRALNFGVRDLIGPQGQTAAPVGASAALDINALNAAGGACSAVASALPGANQPPVLFINANPNPRLTVPEVLPQGASAPVFTFDASGTTDPDGDPLSYQWTPLAGTQDLTIVNPTDVRTDVTVTGNITADVTANFRIEVTDATGSGQTVAADFFRLIDFNAQPSADAGADQAPNLADFTAAGNTIRFDARGSTDADGDPLTYFWTQVSGPPVSLIDASTFAPVFTRAPTNTSQTLTFEVAARDGINAPSTDQVTVTIPAQAAANQLPVADAGPDETFGGYRAGATAILSGENSSDPDGDPLTYQWSFVGAQPNGVVLSNSTARNPSVSASAAAFGSSAAITIDLELEVDDGQGGTATDTKRVTLDQTATNQAPTADAGPDQTIANFNASTPPVQLDGSGSSDPDGDPLIYGWRQTSGPTAVISDPNIVNPTVTLPTGFAGTQVFEFELAVDDGVNVIDRDIVRISATASTSTNTPPVADAGPDQAPDIATYTANNRNVTLDGTNSSDPDGDTLTYAWDLVSGFPPSFTQIGTGATINWQGFTPQSQPQIANIRLTVDDGRGGVTTDTVQITIPASANQAPTADAGPDQIVASYTNGDTITLDGTGSSDPDGDPITYTWTQTAGPSVALSSATAASPTFSVASLTAQTAYTFELVVNDGTTSSVADSVTIDLTPAIVNQAPIVDAGPAATLNRFGSNSTFGFVPNVSDPDGDPLTLTWSQLSGPAVTLINANATNASFRFDPRQDPSQRVVTFRLTADDGINTPVFDDVTVTINPNNAPEPDAGADQTLANYVAGTAVQLDASATVDVNNDPLTYTWRQLSGPSVSISDPSAIMPTFTLPAGTTGTVNLRFAVDVSDGDLTRTDTVDIAVTVNDPPVADAGADQTLNNPANNSTITLDGSGSSDPQGDNLTYSWTQTAGRTLALSSATDVSPTVTYTSGTASTETFTFDLVVNDGFSDSVADSVTITAINNQAPLADAGSDITNIDAFSTVTLNAGGSSDPDGDTLSYTWTQVAGPSVTLSNATSVSPTFTAPDVANLTSLEFEVEVSDGALTATDRVTVSVRPVGSITIVQIAQGGDETFGFTSGLSDLNGNIVTTNGSGQRVALRVPTGTYSVTATDTRDAGFALTGLVCSDTDSTPNLSTRSVSVSLDAGEDVTCTFTSVNSRDAASKEIARFLSARNTLLLSSEPDRDRRLDRLNGTVESGGVSAAGFTMPGSQRLPVQAKVTERDASFSTSLMQMRNSAGQTQLGGQGSVDVWVEGTISRFEIAGQDGDFSVLYAGADYMLSDDVLIGALVQYDQIDLDGRQNGVGAADGDGFMVGPYITARLSDNFYADARFAIGTSENTISPLGTYIDEFDTDRQLFAGSLIGDFPLDETSVFRPAITVRHISETQNEYRDSLGVVIPEQSIDQGEISFAPRYQTEMILGDDVTIRPYAEAEGIYAYGDEIGDLLGNDLRLRIEAGTDFLQSEQLSGSAALFFDGLGTDEFQNTGIRLSFTYTFK
ncbi:MAG: autotransporter domain-containing protein [Pseudomonadota bacterium]